MRTILPLVTLDIASALASLYLSSALILSLTQGLAVTVSAGIVVGFLGAVTAAALTLDIYRQRDGREMAVRMALLMLLGFLALFVLGSLGGITQQEWIIGALALLGFGVLHLIWHMLFRRMRLFSRVGRQVLVLGTGPMAKSMGALCAEGATGARLLGYVAAQAEDVEVPRKLVVGTQGSLLQTVKDLGATQVVVALGERRGAFPLKELLCCKLQGVSVVDAPTFYEGVKRKMLLERITPGWFIFADGFKITPLTRFIKRAFDLVCASVGLLLMLPLFPLLALLIKLDSRGPVFFTQTRVGKDDKLFKVIKFRTMVDGAEARTGAVWAQQQDPRVTRLGRFMRKSRLDEVPQLVNVLLGDMSMVGPRPERPEFVQLLKESIPYYSERHYVKPGLTGWAQVMYHYGSSVDDSFEKLRYDLYYIKNISLWLDLKVILKTFHVVLLGQGGR